MRIRPRSLTATVPLLLAAACAGPPRPTAPVPAPRVESSIRSEAVQTADAMIGAPYRYGGRSPRGFDCSGLVVYSYAVAGLRGLPHSARALERRASPVALAELQPGDLLFFDLEGRKAAHVAIYVGGGSFVHAPSSGKPVERVSFEHVFWGPRIRRAGRLLP